MTKKVHLGLDLGIASVGWALVDEDQKIIARGSHLFPQKSLAGKDISEYGEKIRGQHRRTRRVLNRKKQRKLDFLNMIDQYCYSNQVKLKNNNKLSSLYNSEYQHIFGFSNTQSASDFLFMEAHKYNIWKIYRKGFERSLDPKELFLFLYFKLAYRGTFNIPYSNNNLENYGYEQSLLHNKFEKYLQVNGKYRSKANGDDTFSIYQNWMDIEYILSKCEYISDEFKNDYKKIFMRHREFSKGPGTYKSQTSEYCSDWGIKYKNGEPEVANLWDYKTGECSIAKAKGKDEKKCSSFLCAPEIVNLISQLANVQIMNSQSKDFLNKKIIINCINHSIFNDETLTISRLSKLLNVNKENIFGYPKTKNGDSSNFEKMANTRMYFSEDKPIISLTNDFKKSPECSIELFNDYVNQLDILRLDLMLGVKGEYEGFYINQKNTVQDKSLTSKQKKEIAENNKQFSNNRNIEECKRIASNKIKDWTIHEDKYGVNWDSLCNFNHIEENDFSGVNKYGENAYNEYLNYVYNTADEFSKLESFNQYFKKEIKDGERLKYSISNNSIYLNYKMYENQEFLSPNTRNTIQQAIVVINNILREYIFSNNDDLKLESIAVETTWDSSDIKKDLKKNLEDTLLSESQRERMINYQNYREELKKVAKLKASELGVNINFGNNMTKMMLACEQDFFDAYSKESISDCIEQCQVDHIIPEHISFNSNWENLVLTKNNSDKGDKTAFNYINSKSELKNKYESIILPWWKEIYKKESNKNKDDNESKSKKSIKDEILAKKYEFLTMSNDVALRQGFINSNLSETTYAIRKLINGLRYFLEDLNSYYVYKNDSRYMKIKDCHIRTLSGSLSQMIRKEFANKLADDKFKKNRDLKEHHSLDASICAFYASNKDINDFYNFIENNPWIKWKNEEQNQEKYMENLKHKGPTESNIKKIVGYGAQVFNEELNNHNCIFSHKSVSIFPRNFFKKDIEEQWELLKKIKPRQIFSNENFQSYATENSKNEKRRVLYLDLLKNDEQSSHDPTKISSIFNGLNSYIMENENIDELTATKEYVKKNHILTDYKIIWDLYDVLRKSNFVWTNKLVDLGSVDEENDTPSKDNKKSNNVKESIFKSYISSIDSNILENMRLKSDKSLQPNVNSILNEYVPILDIANNTYYKIKYIKILDNRQFKPTFELTNSFSKRDSNYIFDKKERDVLSKHKCLMGHETKCLVLLEYQDNKKMKINFFKVNQLNRIVNCPSEYKILKIIDYDKWFLLDNKIYKIGGFNIYDDLNNKIFVFSVSDKSIDIRKAYNAWFKICKNDKTDLINKTIINYLTSNDIKK